MSINRVGIASKKARRATAVGIGVGLQPSAAMELQVGPPYFFPDAFEKLGPAEVAKPLPWDELTPEQQAFQAAKMAVHAAMVDRMDQNVRPGLFAVARKWGLGRIR